MGKALKGSSRPLVEGWRTIPILATSRCGISRGCSQTRVLVSEADYLALNGNQLVKFTDGHIELLPTPTTAHQRMVLFLVTALIAFAAARGA